MTVKYNTKENYVYDGRLDLVTAALKEWTSNRAAKFTYSVTRLRIRLGTSSTVNGSTINCHGKMERLELDSYAMADLAYQVEREDLKNDGGYQDQYAATFGGFNFIEFHGRNKRGSESPQN